MDRTCWYCRWFNYKEDKCVFQGHSIKLPKVTSCNYWKKNW